MLLILSQYREDMGLTLKKTVLVQKLAFLGPYNHTITKHT